MTLLLAPLHRHPLPGLGQTIAHEKNVIEENTVIENGAYGVLVLGGGNRIVNNITGKRRRRPWR